MAKFSRFRGYEASMGSMLDSNTLVWQCRERECAILTIFRDVRKTSPHCIAAPLESLSSTAPLPWSPIAAWGYPNTQTP
jgi:hypothetical protein